MSLFELTTPTAVARIRARNAVLNTYVTTRTTEALTEADVLAREPARSRLHGVPYSLKDEFDTEGIATTGGSYRHRDRVPTTSAPVYEALRAAGAVLVGKSNLSDLGLPPEASSFVAGPARNPHDPSRTAGGSSGGSAAAVADGMAAFEWGADIGGSIRQPAAFCGVLGMRLSSETWPLRGFFPSVPPGLDWMCGHGPFSRTTDQMRAVLETVAPTIRAGDERAARATRASLYVPDHAGRWPTFEADVLPHLRDAFDADVVRADAVPPTSRVLDIYASVWASHFEELFASDPSLTVGEGVRATFSGLLFRGVFGDKRIHPATAELLFLIALGRYTIFRDRARALRNARSVRDAVESIWARGEILVAPACMYPAPRIGRTNYNRHVISCTVIGNIADATGLAIPFGRFDDGLPRAIQLLGPPGSENVLLDVADRLIASRDGDATLRDRAA